MSNAKSVSSELKGPSRTITALAAAFCFVVHEAIVSVVCNNDDSLHRNDFILSKTFLF